MDHYNTTYSNNFVTGTNSSQSMSSIFSNSGNFSVAQGGSGIGSSSDDPVEPMTKGMAIFFIIWALMIPTLFYIGTHFIK